MVNLSLGQALVALPDDRLLVDPASWRNTTLDISYGGLAARGTQGGEDMGRMRYGSMECTNSGLVVFCSYGGLC